MDASVQICDMRKASSSFIGVVYREILQPSFSPDELDPLNFVLDGLAKDGSYELWGLTALDGGQAWLHPGLSLPRIRGAAGRLPRGQGW